jgi:hypothetical protein
MSREEGKTQRGLSKELKGTRIFIILWYRFNVELTASFVQKASK